MTVISAVVDSASDRFTCAVESSVTVARFWTLPKPASSAVTVYGPGGTLGKRYRPSADVTAVRVPCRFGLASSTVTPGRGALL